jgi:hypothetical protein
MVKALLAVAVLAAGAAILVASGVLDKLPERTCPYGSNSHSSQTLSCKPRPEPSEAQRAAALDGSAVTAALASFGRAADAGKAVVGVGLNRWGETTFALPTGATAFGKPRERFVTFDHRGGSPPQSNIERRNYVLVRRGSTAFGVGRLRAAPLRRALARVQERGDYRFATAELATRPVGTGVAWLLRFDRRGGGAVLLQMNPSGSGLCGLDRTKRLRAIKTCSAASLLGSATGAADPGEAPPPPAGVPPLGATARDQLELAKCVQRAGGDVAAIQRCMRK